MDSISLFTLFISVVSIGVSITTFVITFTRQQKSQQFRIALEINEKLRETLNRLVDFTKEPRHTIEIQKAKKIYSLQYLDTLEYFSFLVNNKEIANKNIIIYFKPSMILETKKVFQDYPDIAQDNKAFKEIKDLLRKWGEL